MNPDEPGQIEVTMAGNAHPDLTGIILRLERSVSGTWQCVIDTSASSQWNPALNPASCSVI